MHLLTKGNPKIEKGTKKGFLTFILHLAPASLSGWNVCPMATAGCMEACLNTAGRGGIPTARAITIDGVTFLNPIQAARYRRTRLFFEDRHAFMLYLVDDIMAGIRQAERLGLTPVFRLNGTSDIRWERVAVPAGIDHPAAACIMDLFPGVQFYDYTKIANRRDLPANYHLTFSLAENNDVQAFAALANGMNVAAVFDKLPENFMGREVVNGDETDLRFLDPAGVIVGLKAKGKAKRDTSGFVRRLAA